MSNLTDYFKDLRDIYNTGSAVKETSYYSAFESMANAYGKELKPRVRCVINLKNKGAGIPDAGFFTSTQFQRGEDAPRDGQLPERGCAEIKSTKDDVLKIAQTEQVAKYLAHYGAVLVTNYRDFLLIGKDANGNAEHLERFSFADSEAEFWREVRADADGFAARYEKSFDEFIKRVFLHAVPLTKPEDVAWFLASYAREAKERIERAKDLSALQSLRKTMEEALGITFRGEEGEHFFRSTLIQTLFYGVFSAWVLWSKKNPGNTNFDWRTAVYELKVPMIRALYYQVAEPTKLENLGLVALLDQTNKVLNRIIKQEFFQKFSESHAVQYFYEPFLENFDSELRKQLGVWYTPEEIVRYMVARVDTVLKEELNLPDGLADENVYILDPCCGTGAYLVEVLKHIANTLKERGDDATIGATLREAVTKRIFGFEILPAPFVVAHLQIGLFLQTLGTELKDERAAIYLTNALTNWERKDEKQIALPIPEMQEERDQAERVKQTAPILVILGNPPYNAFAGTSPEEEQGLVEPYKDGLIKKWGIKKFNLDDLYIRFFRLAERRITKGDGRGIVSFVTNYSYTSEPSFVVMREKLLESFDKIWIENMHGNRKITERAPDGRTSETVFAIQGFSAGIQQGVTISLMAKTGKDDEVQTVLYRDDINDAKADERRKHLLATLEEKDFAAHYEVAHPTKENRYSFRPSNIGADYQSWLKTSELSESNPSLGILENRKESLIDIEKVKIQDRFQKYFDTKITWDELKALDYGFTKDAARYDAKATREKLLTKETYNEENIRKILMRPFDERWCYYTTSRPLWNEPRPAYVKQLRDGNLTFVTRKQSSSVREGSPIFITRQIGFQHAISTDAYFTPMLLHPVEETSKVTNQNALFGDDEPKEEIKANLSAKARAYLENLGLNDADENAETASLVWYHALAVGYSPVYLAENADGIRQDFPRIPLPAKLEDLQASAELGKRIAALLDTETPVATVTAGKLDAPFASIGALAHSEGGQLQPEDFEITAGWGHAGKGGVTMPAKGRTVERDYTESENAALAQTAERLNLTLEEIKQTLGATTLDIYLNNFAYWRNVPRNVWEYTIGGYQVIKKWLSYRETELLGRALSLAEANETRDTARRICAILLASGDLDKNYLTAKASNAVTNETEK